MLGLVYVCPVRPHIWSEANIRCFYCLFLPSLFGAFRLPVNTQLNRKIMVRTCRLPRQGSNFQSPALWSGRSALDSRWRNPLYWHCVRYRYVATSCKWFPGSPGNHSFRCSDSTFWYIGYGVFVPWGFTSRCTIVGFHSKLLSHRCNTLTP